MKEEKIGARLWLPLYCVRHHELTAVEFEATYPVKDGERVVEIVCGVGIRAFGVHSGALDTPMTVVLTFCDYLEQNGNRGCFVAIETHRINHLYELFPDRFSRVGRAFVAPYLVKAS